MRTASKANTRPGGAYKRNNGKSAKGKFPVAMGRAKHSRSKSRG